MRSLVWVSSDLEEENGMCAGAQEEHCVMTEADWETHRQKLEEARNSRSRVSEGAWLC